jgi:hypothetical protein
MIGREPENERERRAEDRAREDLLLIDDDPLVDDVMSGEAEIGYFIAAMQKGGV